MSTTSSSAPVSARQTPPPVTEWPGRGLRLQDRYRLDDFIASGAAAAVWRAHDTRLDRDVAIKLLLPHRAADDVAVGRFRVEALATARATHPNAVRVYDACTEGQLTFLVMEFVEGPTLDACDMPVSAVVGAALATQIAAALGAAHARGLVHRDVKPGNVLVDPTGRVKVVDFGIARVLDEPTGLTLPHLGLGTARYAAPETLDDGPIGPWTDVYGLGLTVWEALTGRPAFDGRTVHQLVMARVAQEVPDLRELVDVPDPLAEAVLRCTRRDPSERFADAQEAHEAFHAISGPRPHDTTRTLVATESS